LGFDLDPLIGFGKHQIPDAGLDSAGATRERDRAVSENFTPDMDGNLSSSEVNGWRYALCAGRRVAEQR
jgi:hypothetical protein